MVFHNLLRRFSPYLILIGTLILIDQFLFWTVLAPQRTDVIEKNYKDRVSGWIDEQPKLVIIGSSRGEAALPNSVMQEAIDEAGLPHLAINLSIGGGGTPSLIFAALSEFTPVLSSSNVTVVYLFSYFEMNFLRLPLLAEMEAGKQLLEKFNLININHWSNVSRGFSGFGRWVSEWQLENNAPRHLSRIQQESTSPFDIQRLLPQTCNFAGRYNYQIIPANDWAIRQLIRQLGNRFFIVKAPTSQRQVLEDERFGLEAKGRAYVGLLEQNTHVRFIENIGLIPHEAGFSEQDCDHIQQPKDQKTLARLIVKLLPIP